MQSVRLTQKYRGKLPGRVLALDPKQARRLVAGGFAVAVDGDAAKRPPRKGPKKGK